MKKIYIKPLSPPISKNEILTDRSHSSRKRLFGNWVNKRNIRAQNPRNKPIKFQIKPNLDNEISMKNAKFIQKYEKLRLKYNQLNIKNTQFIKEYSENKFRKAWVSQMKKSYKEISVNYPKITGDLTRKLFSPICENTADFVKNKITEFISPTQAVKHKRTKSSNCLIYKDHFEEKLKEIKQNKENEHRMKIMITTVNKFYSPKDGKIFEINNQTQDLKSEQNILKNNINHKRASTRISIRPSILIREFNII